MPWTHSTCAQSLPADWQVGALNSPTHVQAANTNETARALCISPEGVAETGSSGSSHWSCGKAVNAVSKQSKGLPTPSPEYRWTQMDLPRSQARGCRPGFFPQSAFLLTAAGTDTWGRDLRRQDWTLRAPLLHSSPMNHAFCSHGAH